MRGLACAAKSTILKIKKAIARDVGHSCLDRLSVLLR